MNVAALLQRKLGHGGRRHAEIERESRSREGLSRSQTAAVDGLEKTAQLIVLAIFLDPTGDLVGSQSHFAETVSRHETRREPAQSSLRRPHGSRHGGGAGAHHQMIDAFESRKIVFRLHHLNAVDGGGYRNQTAHRRTAVMQPASPAMVAVMTAMMTMFVPGVVGLTLVAVPVSVAMVAVPVLSVPGGGWGATTADGRVQNLVVMTSAGQGHGHHGRVVSHVHQGSTKAMRMVVSLGRCRICRGRICRSRVCRLGLRRGRFDPRKCRGQSHRGFLNMHIVS